MIVTVPVNVPDVVGAKSTLMVQLAPAASVEPQVPRPAKANGAPLICKLLMVKVVLPVLVTVEN